MGGLNVAGTSLNMPHRAPVLKSRANPHRQVLVHQWWPSRTALIRIDCSKFFTAKPFYPVGKLEVIFRIGRPRPLMLTQDLPASRALTTLENTKKTVAFSIKPILCDRPKGTCLARVAGRPAWTEKVIRRTCALFPKHSVSTSHQSQPQRPVP